VSSFQGKKHSGHVNIAGEESNVIIKKKKKKKKKTKVSLWSGKGIRKKEGLMLAQKARRREQIAEKASAEGGKGNPHLSSVGRGRKDCGETPGED